MATELTPDALRRRSDLNNIPFKDTTELPHLDGVIGQPRAIDALNLGLNIPDPTFQIFVAGAPGTGRTTAVQAFLQQKANDKEPPDD